MYGFVEQLLHYFGRPHSGLPTTVLAGPAAWRGSDLAVSLDWQERLDAYQVAELCHAVDVAKASGRSMQEMTAFDFPVPEVGAAIARWRRELLDGRGFLLVRDLPVQRWSRRDAEIAFWGIGLHLGLPGAQNMQGDLLGHVTDLSARAEHADERLYRTNRAIRFHCDAADVVGLLCLAASSRGGASRLVSSVTVFNHLMDRFPELAHRLFEPFLLDARLPADAPVQYTPVQPCTFDGDHLRTFMHSDYFRSVERHAGVEIDPLARRALDAWEEYAELPGIHLDMQLEPGDMQLVSNHTVVHARTAYVDDPSCPRHLLRLWLSIERAAANAAQVHS